MLKSQELHFVAIYSASDSCAITLSGLHIHAMPRDVIQPQACEANLNNFPSRTIVQYGRVDKLMAGNLDSGLSEDGRVAAVGGEFGLAFHLVNVNGIEKVSVCIGSNTCDTGREKYFFIGNMCFIKF